MKNTYNSKMKAKYDSKMKDSFLTKLQLFIFEKAFDCNVEIYFKDNQSSVIENVNDFEITPQLSKLYSAEFYQKKEHTYIEYNNKELSIKEIVSNLTIDCKYILSKTYLYKIDKYVNIQDLYKNLKQEYEKGFKKLFPIHDFKTMIEKTQCEYCGIAIEQIEKLSENQKLYNKRSDTRGYNLEIDRKLPNEEYSTDNCCMSCYWCNNAKTDEFSPKEFKEIARGINTAWNLRYGDKKVIFNNKSPIWEIDYK